MQARLLFISEYPLCQKTSGCMHFKDILECSSVRHSVDHLHISNKIRCTNFFDDRKSIDYEPLGHPTSPVIECGVYKQSRLYKVDIRSYYDDKGIYKNEIDRYIVLNQNRQRSFVFERHLKNWLAENYDLVFVFLQEPSAIFLAEALLDNGVKVVSIIMDPPEMRHFFYQNKELTRDLIDSSFRNVINRSAGLVLPSESAVNESCHKSVCDNTVAAYPVFRTTTKYNYNNYISSSSIKSINNKLEDGRRLRIVLAGQIYAPESLNAFLVALNNIKKNGIMDTVEFVYYGSMDGRNKLSRLKDKPELFGIDIQINDDLDHNQLINIISGKYDFGYTPFPFLGELSDTVSYSFPSKFVSYIEAGIVPLYHGPRSTVSDILSWYDLGCMSIQSIDSENILKKMSLILPRNNANLIEPSLRKLSHLFTRETLTNRMNDLITKVAT